MASEQRGEETRERLQLPFKPIRQTSMPSCTLAKGFGIPENLRPVRQVSFKEKVEEYPTYEKYDGYFSEYDRRPVQRQKSLTASQKNEILDDIKQLRMELFPEEAAVQSATLDMAALSIDTE